MKCISLIRFCAVIVLYAAVSCQKGLDIRITNNSGKSAIITASWSHGDSTTRTVKQGDTAVFDWPLSISVGTGTNKWTYGSFPRLRSGYLESKRFEYRLNMQLQGDGTIFALSGATSGIVTNFGPQPPGFPLRPGK